MQYKNDKAGIIHAGIGKLKFSEEDLLENLKAFYLSISNSAAHRDRVGRRDIGSKTFLEFFLGFFLESFLESLI